MDLGDNVWPVGPDAVRIARLAEHSFLAAPITPGSTVIDLGMNSGQFAATMISRFGCSVVGVEPAPELFESIPDVPGLTAEHAAVTGDGRLATLSLSSSPLAATIDPRLSEPDAPTVAVDGVTLAELLDRHDVARTPLVKVDIEGAEIEMIDTASPETLRRAAQFTIEFHDFLDPAQAGDVRRAKARLRSAGFVEMAFSTDNTDVLFINRSQIAFTAAHQLAAAVLYKYPRGVIRHFARAR